MPLAPSYIDTFKVKNISRHSISLGDLVNLELPVNQVVDLLRVARISKDKINQSNDLKTAINNGWVRVLAQKTPTTTERTIIDNLYRTADSNVVDIAFIIEGGGGYITTGIKGDLEIPFDCQINRVTLLADQLGSIVIDIWKDTFANFPPDAGDSITASDKPTLAIEMSYQNSTLSGWDTSISAGDIIRVNVDSVTTIERVLLSLKATRYN